MGVLLVVVAFYIIISIVVITIDFLEMGIQISLALLSGIAFMALLIGAVRLSLKRRQEEPGLLEEVAATKDKKQFIFRMTLAEKFLYIMVAFIFGGWFLASFTPQANAIEAYKIVEWRILMPIFALVVYIISFAYFRIFSRTQG